MKNTGIQSKRAGNTCFFTINDVGVRKLTSTYAN